MFAAMTSCFVVEAVRAFRACCHRCPSQQPTNSSSRASTTDGRAGDMLNPVVDEEGNTHSETLLSLALDDPLWGVGGTQHEDDRGSGSDQRSDHRSVDWTAAERRRDDPGRTQSTTAAGSLSAQSMV